MKRAEIILLLALTALAVSLGIGATGLKYSDQYSFGPGFVPFNVALLLGFCCALRALRLWRRPQAATEGVVKTDHDMRGLWLAGLIIGGGIAAMSLGSVLGPLAAIIFLLSWQVTRHSPLLSALVSAATTLSIFIIFSVWLNLPVR